MYSRLTLNLLCNQGLAWTPDSPYEDSTGTCSPIWFSVVLSIEPRQAFHWLLSSVSCLPTLKTLVDSGLRTLRKSNTKTMKQEMQVLVPIKEQFYVVKIIYVIETAQVSGTVAILEHWVHGVPQYLPQNLHLLFLYTGGWRPGVRDKRGVWARNGTWIGLAGRFMFLTPDAIPLCLTLCSFLVAAFSLVKG